MAAGTTTVTDIADAAERQKRLELKALLQKEYKWIDRKWDIVFWITAIFVVAGAADITKQLFAGDWDFWTDWKDPQWWPVITAFATIIIPSGVAISHRRDVHLSVLFYGGLGGALLPMACGGELSDEFRVAHFHRLRWYYSRLDADEDEKLPHYVVRRSASLGGSGVGVQLCAIGSISSTCAVHASCADSG